MVVSFFLFLSRFSYFLPCCQGVIYLRHPQASSHFRETRGRRLGEGPLDRSVQDTDFNSSAILCLFPPSLSFWWHFCFLSRSLAHAVTSVSPDRGATWLSLLWSLSFMKPQLFGNRQSVGLMSAVGKSLSAAFHPRPRGPTDYWWTPIWPSHRRSCTMQVLLRQVLNC